MLFVLAAKCCTDAVSQLLHREQPFRFNHAPLAMQPFGLNRVDKGDSWSAAGKPECAPLSLSA
jgi:hypothetical protein